MNDSTTAAQTTLLTSNKGVDLHAASALMVMQERLTGGDLLQDLRRCEFHTIWGRPQGWTPERMLATGRYYNPNKHHFGLFQGRAAGGDWFDAVPPARLPGADWPGAVTQTDLPTVGPEGVSLYDRLLGGPTAVGSAAWDLVGFARGQTGPVLSGVLWRLVIRGDRSEAARVGAELAVARHRKQGLLVNPHMDNWLAVGG